HRGAASATTPSKSGWLALLHVRVTIRVRRSVATFQPYLVGTQLVKLDKESFIQFHAAVGARVDLHHPTLYSIGIELLVPGGVERVGKVHALAVATNLDHLRSAVESLRGLLRVRAAADYSTEMNRAGFFRVRGIGDVVLDELSCPPTRNIEEA